MISKPNRQEFETDRENNQDIKMQRNITDKQKY